MGRAALVTISPAIMAVTSIAASITATMTAVATVMAWGSGLEFFILLLDVQDEIFAKLLRFLNHAIVRAATKM